MPSNPTVTAIILAAGSGSRLGAGMPKAFVEIEHETLLEKTVRVLAAHRRIDRIVIVAPRSHLTLTRDLTRRTSKVTTVVVGGSSRAASLRAGLRYATDDFVLVHNVANPYVTADEISACIAAARQTGAAAVSRPSTATVKVVRGNRVVETPRRETMWMTETPQVVRRDLLLAGMKIAKAQHIEPTDDIQLAELAGVAPALVPASDANRKITTPADIASRLIAVEQRSTKKDTSPSPTTDIRIGLGQDSHRFSDAKKPLVLGGVTLARTGGCAGNSDADVVLHAICNALSSAIGGGSLATWSDEMCRAGMRDSRAYVAEVMQRVAAAGWRVGNVSVSIEAAKPKLEKHLPKLNRSVAKLLGVTPDAVGHTATSGEGLTAVGCGEGIAATAIVTLLK